MQIQFILVKTSHSGNIGSSARAIKVMGFDKLILVNPQCNHLDDTAKAMASSANDILESAQIFSSLEHAISDSSINIALTARVRQYSPPIINSKKLYTFLQHNTFDKCNLIFGNEQFGLSNEDVLLCSHIVHITANPKYSSLNLSQAVQLLAYELSDFNFLQNMPNPKHLKLSASCGEINAMHEHLLQALEHIEFYNQNEPKKLSQRLQKLWAKSSLDIEEVNILRGIAKSILKKI